MFVWQHGTPPLLIAAGCGNIQIIEVLMRKGAEIQAGDKVKMVCGVWSAWLSCWNRHPSCSNEESGSYICPSRQNSKRTSFLNLQSGANAIYYAARHGHVETLKFLHEKKCPLDIQDKVNQVPAVFPPVLFYVIQTHTRAFKSTHLRQATAQQAWFSPHRRLRAYLSGLWSIIALVFQNVQTHRFTLTTLSTWRENQLLWHFISLFAVAIETEFAGEDCMCVFAFTTGATSATEFL